MDFNPFNLIGKAIMTVNIQGKASERAADRAVLILASAAGAALLLLAAGAMVWLMK